MVQLFIFLAVVLNAWPTVSGQLNACAVNPCNAGTCTPQPNGYSCTCFDGYSGRDCNTQIFPCRPNPCRNNATCRDYWSHSVDGSCGGFYCQCPHQYYTGKLCETVIDVCASSPCVTGTCIAFTVDSYKCVCPPGYSGYRCEEKIPRCRSNLCQNGGTCAEGVTDDMWYCICTARYTGQRCETALNDCSSHPCQNGGKCCEEEGGRYTCECKPEYTGRLCETKINNCQSLPCRNGGKCNDQIGGYNCTCALGWTGKQCEIDISACRSGPCQNGGSCTPTTNSSYTCRCQIGWYGRNCERDACSLVPHLCINGGTCIVKGQETVYCLCPLAYTGNRCEYALSTTVSTPVTTSPTTSSSQQTPHTTTVSTLVTTPITTSTTTFTTTTQINPTTTVSTAVSASSSINDTVVRVYVLRRALNGLPAMCGRLAHSGLLLKTRSGKYYVVEYMNTGKSNKYKATFTKKAGVTHPAGATIITMKDEVTGITHDWTKQNVGTAMPDKVKVTPDEAQKQMQKIMGANYNLLKNNCHMGQELLRLTWGMKVQRKRDVESYNEDENLPQNQWSKEGIEDYFKGM